MRQKVKIIDHGNTWIDTSMPKVCPECASLNIKEYMHDDSRWRGPFYIKYIETVYQCNDCHCSFKLDKDRKKISDISLDEFFGYIALITFILFLITFAVALYLYHDSDTLPPLMTAVILISFGICIFSGVIWLILQ